MLRDICIFDAKSNFECNTLNAVCTEENKNAVFIQPKNFFIDQINFCRIFHYFFKIYFCVFKKSPSFWDDTRKHLFYATKFW